MGKSDMSFNHLLEQAGIPVGDVRLLRHHTKPGLAGRTLHDLWRNDRKGFELYQSTQDAGAKLFRTGKIWAAFVSPKPGTTIFVGLYDSELSDTRAVEWECPYRGGPPGGGAPVDVFRTALRTDLSQYIGKLQVDWDLKSVRSWARYASSTSFPVHIEDDVSSARDGFALVESAEEIAENLAYFDSLRRKPGEQEFIEYSGFIERGTCLLPYRIDDRLAFSPSRLVGYKLNNLSRHEANSIKHGSATNTAISKILRHEPVEDAALEKAYRDFCESLGFKARPTAPFGNRRKYWPPINIGLSNSRRRASPTAMRFTVGQLYARREIADLIGLSEQQRGGDWLTGYCRKNGEFYLFVNVGTGGRTGHDYANQWDGKDLIWLGKSRTRLGQTEIDAILGGEYPVHIFWRGSDRAPFTYAGLGSPVEARDSSPVQVRWAFGVSSRQANAAPGPSGRRGPPPSAGTRTSVRTDGPTSVYLLKLEGPVEAAFPALLPGWSVVKIGMSNDVERRVEELSGGFPPGCTMVWQPIATRSLESGAQAYALETKILERLRVTQRWIGGEFAIVPKDEFDALSLLV